MFPTGLGLLACLFAQGVEPASAAPTPERREARAVWVDPKELVLDGDPREWIGTGPPPIVLADSAQLISLGPPVEQWWSGPRDASLRLHVGWNEQDLLLGGIVLDEWSDHDPEAWFRGDSLELFLNAVDRVPAWGADDYQVMLAPDWSERPWGVYPRPVHGGPPSPGPGGFGGVEVASIALDARAAAELAPSLSGLEGAEVRGYRFELRIPWANFAGFVPQPGDRVPFNFALCDRDGKGQQESYLTWTGEGGIAAWADRRGTLVLEPPPVSVGSTTRGTRRWPSAMPLFLAGMYALALFTRRAWRSPGARRRALLVAGLLMSASGAVAVLARVSSEQGTVSRRVGLERYWSSFEALLGGSALGHPEPSQLMRASSALLAGDAIAAPAQEGFVHLAPEGLELGAEQQTASRALPFRPILPAASSDPRRESGVATPARGIALDPGEECLLVLPSAAAIDAFHLITRVSDRRFLDVGVAPVPVLSVQFIEGEQQVLPTREVRHRQDLHLDEEEHVEHPGLELAYDELGGRLGRVHADGLLLDLGAPHEIDRVRIRHVGTQPGYVIELVAAAAIQRTRRSTLPPGIRTNAGGEWEWAGWREDVEAEVTPLGRGPRGDASVALLRPLAIGKTSVAAVYLTDRAPPPQHARWDFLPIVVAASLAPFLVALMAEWLANRRRIRAKLAAGFAITSAVPLLALTLLLQASLDKEHEISDRERVAGLVTMAESELERDRAGLELEARRLLRIAELRARIEGRFPASSAELASPNWWGEGEVGVMRLLDRVQGDGSRVRIGTGPGWREMPRSFRPGASDILRPWGELLTCGVAQTASGATQSLSVVVARPTRLSAAMAASGDVRLHGADRDAAPTLDVLTPEGPREVRRGVFNAERDLVAVLRVRGHERGVALIGDYSLTELLVAAGLTALFTAALFAGILTGNIVRPIESLDRAVREGRPASLQAVVPDEIGHLTDAIGSFAGELALRLEQLQTLRTAQEELSSHLEWERACEGVLQFFREQTGAARVWLFWAGVGGMEPRVFGTRGGAEERAPPAGQLFERALGPHDGLVLGEGDLADLEPAERALFTGCRQALLFPLSAGGERRGALALGYTSPGNEDEDFLRAAASQVAVVLENARLYQQASEDPVTTFLFDGGFKLRLSEEIQRAEGSSAAVLLAQVRLGDLPADDLRATERLREAARRVRASVRGLAVFGRAGAADLRVVVPHVGAGVAGPAAAEALARRIVVRVGRDAWPDGEVVNGLSSSSAAWPADGPSGRLVLQLLDERLADARAVASTTSQRADLRAGLPADFVAASPLMLELLDTTRRVAEEDLTVLVVGETGVGKDRIAKLVHEWSPRKAGPLVHIHCPSLPPNLIEAELFGHEAGAFTGAAQRRMGPFEYAAGGTVVLDEVGGLPSEGQVALLRLLETREVLPLGATRPVPIDVRVVATSSTDLAAAVDSGGFRSDLYFRLNVAQMTVPPLRLRRQDLPGLVEALVERHNASAGRPVTGVAPEVLDLLFDHAWPGNLRELENVVAGGLLLAAGAQLRPEHLSLSTEQATARVPGGAGPVALNPRQVACLGATAAGGWIRSAEYAVLHGISARTGLRDLNELADLGFLLREGKRKAVRFRRTARKAPPDPSGVQ